MNEDKTWKVVAILNEYDIVINVGADDVKQGQRLEVFERGPEIKDPDTGEFLGHVSLIKARLRVKQVEPRIAIATSDEFQQPTQAPNIVPPNPSLPDVLQPSPAYRSWMETLTRLTEQMPSAPPKPLNIRPEDAIGALTRRSNKPIVKGDLVRLAPDTLAKTRAQRAG